MPIINQDESEGLRAWQLLLAFALFALLACLAWQALPLVMQSKFIVLKVSTAGTPQLYGIPLTNKIIRQGVFGILGHSKAHVRLTVPLGSSLEKAKVPETLNAMANAGITRVSIRTQMK